MIVAIPKETYPGERRVALVPGGIAALAKAKLAVRVEAGAGAAAGFPDSAYAEKGATVVGSRAELLDGADVVLCVRGGGAEIPAAAEGAQPAATAPEGSLASQLRPGQLVLGFLDPLRAPEAARALAARGVTAYALELLPRVTRAQSMDALSSQATIAGYRAVLMAAMHLPRMFPMLTTAAGTIAPAKVLVVGAGVAGLQAIATARRLGAVVSGYDVRTAVREQIQSLGARFVELPLETAAAEGTGGYAAAQSEEFYARQRQLLGQVVAQNDVLITTAAIPGKRSPLLVNADAIEAMAPGSVVVDLAAERGGNCESTRSGEIYQLPNSTTLAGPTNLPSEVPYHASQMLSKNLVTLLLHLVKEGAVKLDMEDQITRETLLARDGEVAAPRVRELLGLPAAAAGVTSVPS